MLVSDSGEINACYNKYTGHVRLVSKAGACGRHERAISWNNQGPQGVPGAQGEQGVAGPPGDAAVVEETWPEPIVSVGSGGGATTAAIGKGNSGGSYAMEIGDNSAPVTINSIGGNAEIS